MSTQQLAPEEVSEKQSLAEVEAVKSPKARAPKTRAPKARALKSARTLAPSDTQKSEKAVGGDINQPDDKKVPTT